MYNLYVHISLERSISRHLWPDLAKSDPATFGSPDSLWEAIVFLSYGKEYSLIVKFSYRNCGNFHLGTCAVEFF